VSRGAPDIHSGPTQASAFQLALPLQIWRAGRPGADFGVCIRAASGAGACGLGMAQGSATRSFYSRLFRKLNVLCSGKVADPGNSQFRICSRFGPRAPHQPLEPRSTTVEDSSPFEPNCPCLTAWPGPVGLPAKPALVFEAALPALRQRAAAAGQCPPTTSTPREAQFPSPALGALRCPSLRIRGGGNRRLAPTPPSAEDCSINRAAVRKSPNRGAPKKNFPESGIWLLG